MANLVREVTENVYQVGKIQFYTNSELGIGENSVVYRGKYEKSQIHAIKIRTNLGVEQKTYKERLDNECDHLKRCTSDNIIKFYGFEEIKQGNSVTL